MANSICSSLAALSEMHPQLQVKEMDAGNECGVTVEDFSDWRQGDRLQVSFPDFTHASKIQVQTSPCCS